MSDEKVMERVRRLRADGHSPRQIARALGLRRADADALVRKVAQENAAAAAEPALLRCLVSPGWSTGLTIEGREAWPDSGTAATDAAGLASVLIAREHRHGSVSICGYLVDVYCLGVKDALGPQVMRRHELPALMRAYFAPFEAGPLDVPIELARELVLGAVDYARGLGFEPHPDFAAARGHLGAWEGPSAIRFGREGVPLFVQGTRDDAAHVLRTLERSVGRDGFQYVVACDLEGGGFARSAA